MPATRVSGRWINDTVLDPETDVGATRISGRWIQNAVLDPGGGGGGDENLDANGLVAAVNSTALVSDINSLITQVEGDTDGSAIAAQAPEWNNFYRRAGGVSATLNAVSQKTLSGPAKDALDALQLCVDNEIVNDPDGVFDLFAEDAGGSNKTAILAALNDILDDLGDVETAYP